MRPHDPSHLIGHAYALAARVHTTQVDKSGVAYFEHVYEVARRARKEYDRIPHSTTSDRARVLVIVAAILHDVVEDYEGPEAEIIKILHDEFGAEVTQIVGGRLTRPPGVSYEAYIERVSRDPIARIVKLADLSHNLDPGRVPPPDRFSRDKYLASREKYNRAYVRLLRDA